MGLTLLEYLDDHLANVAKCINEENIGLANANVASMVYTSSIALVAVLVMTMGVED